MSTLFVEVYPKYQCLEVDLGLGEEGVKNHLRYVKYYMVDTEVSNFNLVGYLTKSINQYIIQVKITEAKE